MTASTRDRSRELDDGTESAWTAYRESLRDLAGKEYEEAESKSWQRLQRKLKELEGKRAELDSTRRPRRRA